MLHSKAPRRQTEKKDANKGSPGRATNEEAAPEEGRREAKSHQKAEGKSH